MNAQKAARRCVRHALDDNVEDFLNFIAPGGQTRDYLRPVDKAVRRKLRASEDRVSKLELALQRSVPKQYRKKLRNAVIAFSDAFTQEICVREETAYLIGIEVGRALRRMP